MVQWSSHPPMASPSSSMCPPASPVLTSVITLHTTSPSFPRLLLLCVPCRFPVATLCQSCLLSLWACVLLSASQPGSSHKSCGPQHCSQALENILISTAPDPKGTPDCLCPSAPFPALARPPPITLVQGFPKSFFEHYCMCSSFLLMTVYFCWHVPHRSWEVSVAWRTQHTVGP